VSVFIDTSAFISLIDRDERNHVAARRTWVILVEQNTPLYCTSYVLSETAALIQNRLGMDQLRAFHENVFPFLKHWSIIFFCFQN